MDSVKAYIVRKKVNAEMMANESSERGCTELFRLRARGRYYTRKNINEKNNKVRTKYRDGGD